MSRGNFKVFLSGSERAGRTGVPALALKSIASVHTAVVLRKMTLEVAAIVKNASDVDYLPIVAAPVKDEMARIVYDAEGSLRAVAAETDMVRPSPIYHDLGPIDGTVTVGLALDVAERLHD
jgi:hypothetical protein